MCEKVRDTGMPAWHSLSVSPGKATAPVFCKSPSLMCSRQAEENIVFSSLSSPTLPSPFRTDSSRGSSRTALGLLEFL